MAEFPRVTIPGAAPLPQWQIDANELFQTRIRPEIDEWIRRMVQAEAAWRDILLIGLLARNPWWLRLVAQSPRWESLRHG